jgi:hypothetical protein
MAKRHTGGPIPRVSDEVLLQVQAETNSVMETAKRVGLSHSTVSERLKRLRGASPTIFTPDETNARVNRFLELLDNANVQPDALGRIKGATLSQWGGGIKNKDGEWEEHGLDSTKLEFIPSEPKFPLIQPATPGVIVHADGGSRFVSKLKSIVVVSDAQIGYLRHPQTRALTPTHDPRAIEVVRQIIAHLKPAKVIGIGDWMDWPIFSRFIKHPEYFGVTQASIQSGYEWKARLIAAAPADCEHIEIGSNHGLRPEKFIMEHNREAMYLTRAKRPDARGEEWPLFSEAFMLHYDELGIRFSGQYPGGEEEILPGFFAMHAPPKVREFAANVVHGHTHKLSLTPGVIHGRVRQDYQVIDTGCLCALTQNTDTRSLHVTRVPSDRGRTDWVQGVTVIEYEEGSNLYQSYLVRIQDGQARFAGEVFDGRNVQEPWLKDEQVVTEPGANE